MLARVMFAIRELLFAFFQLGKFFMFLKAISYKNDVAWEMLYLFLHNELVISFRQRLKTYCLKRIAASFS